MRRPGTPGEDAGAHPQAGARSARTSPSARPSSSASPARPRRISRCCSTGWTRPRSTASAASNTSRSQGAPANDLGGAGSAGGQGGALAPLHADASRRSAPSMLQKQGRQAPAGHHRRGRADRRQGPHQIRRAGDRRRRLRRLAPAAAARRRSSRSRSSARTPTTCTDGVARSDPPAKGLESRQEPVHAAPCDSQRKGSRRRSAALLSLMEPVTGR